MKSSGTSFDSLFETYANMRDRSEITEEIAAIRSLVGEAPDLERDGAIDDMSGIVDHFYYKGYHDALEWVVGDHEAKAQGGTIA